MNILITGGLGFVGRNLSQMFLQEGHHVTVTGSNPKRPPIPHDQFTYIAADTSLPGEWQQHVSKAHLIVNLAGRTIFHLWTRHYKQQMYDSRILTTRNIVDALPTDSNAITLISTSAIGYYGDSGNHVLTEESPMGFDFLARLSKDWEVEAVNAQAKNCRVVILRSSVVLDGNGGALGMMIPAFRFCLGGPLGNGKQWFSWIHMADLMKVYAFLIDRPDIDGIVNLCTPYPIPNAEFTQVVAAALKRPAFMPAPGFMLKLVMGELGQLVLNSQRAVPQRLMEQGFTFDYPQIKDAIAEIIAR